MIELALDASQEPRPRESAEDLFASHCRGRRLPPFERQHRFAKQIGRQWRFDFAFPDYKLAVEIEGVVVRRIGGELIVMGRHATVAGMREDMAKYNTAALLGWTVLRFQQTDVKPKHALAMTLRVLASRGWRQTCSP